MTLFECILFLALKLAFTRLSIHTGCVQVRPVVFGIAVHYFLVSGEPEHQYTIFSLVLGKIYI